MPNINTDQLRRAQIIDMLRDEPGLSTAQMAERLRITPRMIQGALASMQSDGIISCARNKRKQPGEWELTPAYLKQIADNLTPPIRRDFHNGVYTCPELRPFTGRPGAMDAYRLPSRGF